MNQTNNTAGWLPKPVENKGHRYTSIAALLCSLVLTLDSANAQGPVMTKEKFEAATQHLKDTYYKAGIPEAHSYSFEVKADWESNDKGVSISSRGNRSNIVVSGGFARIFDGNVGPDVVSLVVCTMLGQRFAGFPGTNATNIGIKANEGNKAYYASYACTTLLWQDQHEQNAKSRALVDEKSKLFCDSTYPDQQQAQNLCYRKMVAATAFMTFSNRDKPVHVDKPSTEVLEKTTNRRPGIQCMMDTFMAGIACKAYENWDHFSIPRTEAEMAKVSCGGEYPQDPAKTIALGYRPRCWFAPSGEGVR